MTDQLPPTALAQELADGLRSVLGPDLLAVYLHGSVVAGDFVPGVSDIDLLVVVERDLDDSITERLRSFHARAVARHPDWHDRLELVYVGWISDFYLVRESGVTVFGPPPPDTIPPISWTEFVAEIRRNADEVAARDLRDATPASRAYCVLTMCRALATIHEEQPCSKEKAATLVRTWMPEWAWLIDEAEGCRLARGRSGLASDRMVEKAAAFIALLAGSIDIG